MAALGIVNITAVAGYNNSELKITLTEEYSWFKGQQFRELINRHKIVYGSNEKSTRTEANDSSGTSQSQTTNELADESNDDTKSRQSILDSYNNGGSQSHVESKFTIDAHRKNSESCDNFENDPASINDYFNSIDSNKNKNNLSEIKLGNNKELELNKSSNDLFDKELKSEEKNNAPVWGSDPIHYVTVTGSHGHVNADDANNHNLTLKEVLNKIKEANGSQISFNAAIESAWSKNQLVRAYLGDKLTSRENKKVRRLAEIIHHENIEVIKTRPQIILRWTNSPPKAEKNLSDVV
jgi:hypothetical protein